MTSHAPKPLLCAENRGAGLEYTHSHFSRECFFQIKNKPRNCEVSCGTSKEKDLPDTGVGVEWERVLSSVFIQSAKYGTRCSTAVLIDNDNNVRFAEKTFFGHQGAFSNKDYNFKLEN